MGLFRKIEIPEVLEQVLESGEKLLATATDPEGRVVAATDRTLILQRRPPDYSRVGWDVIDKASFADGVLTLTLSASEGGAKLRIPLPDPGKLPEVVRDRVTSSILHNQEVALPGGGSVRVVARRRSDADGVRWQQVPGTGVDADAADVAAAIARAVEQVRAESGLG